MVTYVLDASAVIRYLDNEPGAERVEQIFIMVRSGLCLASISAVNWGEVAGKIASRRGKKAAEEILPLILNFGLTVTPADGRRAERAGLIKIKYNMPYADAFGVELARDSPDHILVTADFDAQPAEQDIRIEFLAKKHRP